MDKGKQGNDQKISPRGMSSSDEESSEMAEKKLDKI